MQIDRLHHINLMTHDQERLGLFYGDVLGLTVGDRPPFDNKGTWLYLGETPIVHLVEVEAEFKNEEPRINHFALQGRGLAEFIERLRALDVPYNARVVPQIDLPQVEVLDPDGNKFEVLFASDEEADLTPYKWSH